MTASPFTLSDLWLRTRCCICDWCRIFAMSFYRLLAWYSTTCCCEACMAVYCCYICRHSSVSEITCIFRRPPPKTYLQCRRHSVSGFFLLWPNLWVCVSGKFCGHHISKTNKGNFTQFWSQIYLGSYMSWLDLGVKGQGHSRQRYNCRWQPIEFHLVVVLMCYFDMFIKINIWKACQMYQFVFEIHCEVKNWVLNVSIFWGVMLADFQPSCDTWSGHSAWDWRTFVLSCELILGSLSQTRLVLLTSQ